MAADGAGGHSEGRTGKKNASSEHKSFRRKSLDESNVMSLPSCPAPAGGLASAEATRGRGPHSLAVFGAEEFVGALDVRTLEEFNGLPRAVQHGSSEL